MDASPTTGSVDQTADAVPPNATSEQAPPTRRKRPADRPGIFFPIDSYDLDKITREHPECAPSIVALWVTLMREASYMRSLKVTMGDGVAADRAKLSRRTVVAIKPWFTVLGLATFRSERANGSKRQLPTVWVLTPTTAPLGVKDPCAMGECIAHGTREQRMRVSPDAQALTPPSGGLYQSPHGRGGNNNSDSARVPRRGGNKPPAGRAEKGKAEFKPVRLDGSAQEDWSGLFTGAQQ